VTNQQQTGAQLIEWENLVQNIVCLRSQLKIEAAAGRENEGKTRREKKTNREINRRLNEEKKRKYVKGKQMGCLIGVKLIRSLREDSRPDM